MSHFKETIEQVTSFENKQRVEDDNERFMIYNGRIRDAVKRAITKEFQLPETVQQLVGRIIPINITQKIINKLASVYNQAPVRTPKDKDLNDQELINLYQESFMIDQKMKFANRWFKLHKHTVIEPFVDHLGVPRMRALASQMYTPFSDDPLQPERMTMLVKHAKISTTSPKDSRFHIWTDEMFVIVDGEGSPLLNEMVALNNPEGVNPFGVIPQTYIAEADDGNLIPISDDDLISMSIAIPLLLTDLAFASKYQLWSILAIIGAEAENVTFNPNTVMSIPMGASLEVIKPELDVDKALRTIEALVGLLLTTKNLSVSDVSLSLEGGKEASGVAKMIDNAETTEDRKDQQAFFANGEKTFWDKYARNILPVWVESKQLHQDYVGKFSEEFELSIRFADPKPFIGDKDTVDLEVVKKDNNLTTDKMALQAIHPDKDEEEIQALLDEIGKANQEKVEAARKAMAEKPEEEDKEEEDGEDGTGA